MIIFSSFRALAVMVLGLLLFGGLSNLSPHTALPGVVLFLVGLGMFLLGRAMSAPRQVQTLTGPGFRRESHSVFFVPVWVWGAVAMALAVPLAIHPV